MAIAPRELLATARQRVSVLTPWHVVAIALTVLYTLWLALRTTRDHFGLGTSAYDFGLYDQGVWLLSQGRAPFVTLMGRNLFGDHTSFILLPLVPLYWVVSSTGLLFGAQALALGLGAVPMWKATRELLGEPSYACVAVVAYLAHPALTYTGRENFHPDAALAPLIAWAIYAALGYRWRQYAFAVLLILSVKEDTGLFVAALGVWVALRRDRRVGLVTLFGSLWCAALLMFAVMRGIIGVPYRNEWRLPFGGFGGLVRTSLTRPDKLIRHLVSGDRPWYLVQLLAPVGFVALLRPEIVLLGTLPLLSNLVSTFWYQSQIEYHYAVQFVPILVLGSMWAISRVQMHLRQWLVGVVLASSLVSAWVWTPLPFMRTRMAEYSPSHPAVAAARQAIDEVPEDAVVSAFHTLTAHMARRERIYVFPVPFRRVLYGPNVFAKDDRLPFVDEIQYVILPRELDGEAALDWQREQLSYRIVFGNDYWTVYERLP
ncbi:MAG: DUF2079 domain-containing protein [Actinobacteria bacterium]|nr:DUF2079 domain-containing protein [Actinomycetota bacterium]